MRRSLLLLALLSACGEKEAPPAKREKVVVVEEKAPKPDAAPTVMPEQIFHLVVPAAPAAAAKKAQLVLHFDGATDDDERYVRVRFAVGDGEEQELPLGEATTVDVPVGLLRVSLGAGDERKELLVWAEPGDRVSIYDGPKKGWAASRFIAAREGKAVAMKCAKRGAQCPRGYYAAANEAALYPKCGQYYCVEAPKVRLAGPFAGKATLTPASPDGELGEADLAALGPEQLDKGEHGPWVLTWATDDDIPEVHLGDQHAYLLVAAGERWEVKRGDKGVEARLLSEDGK